MESGPPGPFSLRPGGLPKSSSAARAQAPAALSFERLTQAVERYSLATSGEV